MPNGIGTFRVMLRMEIKPGMGPEFEQTWRAVGEAVTSHEANLGQWLMRDTDNDDIYYIISDWTDEPRFREFEHSDEHVEHRQKLHPYRSGGTMATMSVVQALAPGAVRA